MTHPASLDEDDLMRDCRLSFRRASGPGGQNRNKVETAVAVKHLPTGLSGQASERRSQGENRQVAIQRLRILLAISVRTFPTPTGQNLVSNYVRNGRLAISLMNEDWPAVLAELLDRIAENQWQIGPVATAYHTSPTQILKTIAKEPAAFRYLNDCRQQAGLTPLKV